MISVYTLWRLPLGSLNDLNDLKKISRGGGQTQVENDKIRLLQLLKIYHQLGLLLVGSTLLLHYFF
jgi:hypothetical protein